MNEIYPRVQFIIVTDIYKMLKLKTNKLV